MFRAWVWACFLSLCATCCRADEPPFLKNKKYNEGAYGNYPTHKFKTCDVEPPRLNFMEPFTGCDDGSYIFVTPRGYVAWSAFYILDAEGSLIWGPDHRYGEVYNFQVQHYKGEPYLFFWAGDDSVGGHGEGKYYMLDQHYEEHQSISAGEGIRGDLHSFSITEQDTAVFTAYEVVQKDLTQVGKSNESFIWESIFQELDIETGEVLFEWRASDHFPFEDSYVNPNEATHAGPWDFFHINMVEKDKEGNYLVSTRYGRCVLYVDGKTGDILWRLGGKKNSFQDLSDGKATTFLGQHDAHWDGGHKAITMFDNRADWFNRIEDESAGQRIEVDLERMTARLAQEFRHPEHILSTSQGSYQTLPNGNVLLGYGFNGVLTEYSPDGEVICDAYMQPQSRIASGDVQSYRNLKFNWTGIPLSTPDIEFEDSILYVSWLGSTKVRSWLIQDCDFADGTFRSVQNVPKKGFETEINLKEGKRMRQYVRAIAVDQGGTQLSISPPVDLLDPVAIWGPAPPGVEFDEIHDLTNPNYDEHFEEEIEDVQVILVLGILAMISAALVAWMTFGSGCIPWRRKRVYVGKYQDDGKMRQAWERLRSNIPRTTMSWRDTARHGLLRRDEREEMGDMALSNSEYSAGE